MPSSIEQRAAAIEAIVFDVDGVLTGGEVLYGPGGEWKAFHIHDGQGFELARAAGLKTALLTGRSCDALTRRAAELQVAALRDGVKDKGAAVEGLAGELGVRLEQVCYVGDDLLDLAAMRKAGLAVAVANAVDEVKGAAAWTTSRRGGEGAAREVIELVVKAKGRWAEVVGRYTGAGR